MCASEKAKWHFKQINKRLLFSTVYNAFAKNSASLLSKMSLVKVIEVEHKMWKERKATFFIFFGFDFDFMQHSE